MCNISFSLCIARSTLSTRALTYWMINIMQSPFLLRPPSRIIFSQYFSLPGSNTLTNLCYRPSYFRTVFIISPMLFSRAIVYPILFSLSICRLEQAAAHIRTSFEFMHVQYLSNILLTIKDSIFFVVGNSCD